MIDINKRNAVLICPYVGGDAEYTYNVRILNGVMKHRLLGYNPIYRLDTTTDIMGTLDENTVKMCSNIINNLVASYIRGRHLLSTLNGRNEIYDNLVLAIKTGVLVNSTDRDWIWLGVSMSDKFTRGLKLIVKGYDTVEEADKIIDDIVSKHAVITEIRNKIITAVMVKEVI